MTGVVVGVNGSAESAQALDWALVEAATRGVSLTAVQAWQPGSRSPEPAQYAQLVERKHEEMLTILDLALQRTGVDVPTQAHLVEGPAADVLLAAHEDADMLVLGRRSMGRLGRLVLGSVSSTIVEHAKRPVTVVRRHDEIEPHEDVPAAPAEGSADGGPAAGGRPRVVVGVDTSPPSIAALRHGADAAARLDGVLEVMFGWQITTLAPLPGSWGWAPPVDEYMRFAESALDTAIAQAGLALPEDRIVRRVEHGQSSAVLLAASQGADRLVVGNRGLGGFGRLLLGSTSRQVLEYAACPVTVVRA